MEAPGAATQAMVVGAANKDYDNRFDDTQSGDPCAGWLHDLPPFSDRRIDPTVVLCGTTANAHPPSLAAVTARGPTGDLWLRPDLVAPGYNIVSAQASTGTALAGNDWNPGTFTDPLYATATGTSMATPAASGSAALLLQAYRDAHGGADPTGASGVAGRTAPPYVLLRAALMNTARPDLYEARWIIPPAPGGLVELIGVEVRSRAADPYVGPLAEGAGKVDVGGAVAAIRSGVVAYSVASGSTRRTTPTPGRATSRGPGRSAPSTPAPRSRSGSSSTRHRARPGSPRRSRTRPAIRPTAPARCRPRG